MPDTVLAAPAIANVFPAKVTTPTGEVIDKVRAILTPDLLVIYDELDMGGGMRRVHTQLKASVSEMHPDPDRFDGWYATSDEGEWRIQRGSGCGCGSPLRMMPSPPPVDI